MTDPHLQKAADEILEISAELARRNPELPHVITGIRDVQITDTQFIMNDTRVALDNLPWYIDWLRSYLGPEEREAYYRKWPPQSETQPIKLI